MCACVCVSACACVCGCVRASVRRSVFCKANRTFLSGSPETRIAVKLNAFNYSIELGSLCLYYFPMQLLTRESSTEDSLILFHFSRSMTLNRPEIITTLA